MSKLLAAALAKRPGPWQVLFDKLGCRTMADRREVVVHFMGDDVGEGEHMPAKFEQVAEGTLLTNQPKDIHPACPACRFLLKHDGQALLIPKDRA